MCNSRLIKQITVNYTACISFGHERPNKRLPLPEGRGGGGEYGYAWVFNSREERVGNTA